MEIFQDTRVWVLFSFLIFFCFMWKYAKDAVLAILDKRIESIRKDIEAAESLRVEARELLAQYQRKQRDTAKEADEIIANAKTHAVKIKKQAEKDLKEIAARREQQLAERLKNMEKNAVQEMKAYAAELAIKATSDIIAKQMDKETNENLVNQSIKDVSKQLG